MLLKSGIEEFLKWDYIGAPWEKPKEGCFVGNGGLSLRTRDKMIEITEKYKSDLIDDGEVGLVTELKSSFSAKFVPLEGSPEIKISMSAPTTTPVNGTPIFKT